MKVTQRIKPWAREAAMMDENSARYLIRARYAELLAEAALHRRAEDFRRGRRASRTAAGQPRVGAGLSPGRGWMTTRPGGGEYLAS